MYTIGSIVEGATEQSNADTEFIVFQLGFWFFFALFMWMLVRGSEPTEDERETIKANTAAFVRATAQVKKPGRRHSIGSLKGKRRGGIINPR